MRIVVDLQACQSGSRFGGIGRYSMDLFKNMVTMSQSDEFIVLLNSLFPQTENEVRSALRNIVSPGNIVSFPAPRGCASARRNRSLTQAAEVIRENFIASLNPDVVHVASLVEGMHEDIVTSIGKSSRNPPTAATFYDLIPMVESDVYLCDRLAKAHYHEKIRSLSKADALLAISQFVADEGTRLLPDFHGLMTNIKGGIGKQFRILQSGSHTAEARRKFGLSKKFILYVASFDQRKNQAGLIKAFAKIRDERRDEYQLAFAGGGDAGIYARLHDVAAKCGLSTDDVVFLGRVNDQDLVTLYNTCSVFAFPPLSEGLGMPPLEAAACGAVVIGSATSSVPEVIGWSDALFDPYNTDSMADKLRQALFDDEFRIESRARIASQLSHYQWEHSAVAALDALRIIAKEKSCGTLAVSCVTDLIKHASCEDLIDVDLQETARCAIMADTSEQAAQDHGQLRIGWVSSWGGRCGIASYSMSLIEHMDPKPIVFATYKGDANTSAAHGVVRCWADGKEDYLVELQAAIADADIDIVHIQFNYGFFDFESLRKLIVNMAVTGKAVFMTMHSTLDQVDEPNYCLSWLVDALRLCSRIFVHSIHDVDRLAKLDIIENVSLIPLGMKHHSSAQKGMEQQSAGNRPSTRTVATFGFALPGKGLLEAIEAMSILRSQGRNIHLKMVNAHYQDEHGISSAMVEEIKRKIDQLQMRDMVTTQFAYLEEDQVLSSLSEADIVLYPYTKTGESSSAAIRAGLSVDRVVAVSPLPIFDDVKEAVFVLPGTSPSEIASGLSELIEGMEKDDQSIRRLSSVKGKLVQATSYKNISKFIFQQMMRDYEFCRFVEVFRSSERKVSIVNGVWQDGHIVAEESAGLLCYGPYIELTKGIYRIILKGHFPENKNSASLIISSKNIRIASIQMNGKDGDFVYDYHFTLENDLDFTEFLIEIPGNSAFRLFGYQLLKRWK